MKACTKCKTEKPLDDFHRATKASDGRASWCKACAKSAYRVARKRTYAPENKRRWALKTRYGLTPDDIQRMREKQQHKCAICETQLLDDVRPCIDHCHNTGAVRGLLCHRCNIRLGGWDDLQWRSRAVAYLGIRGDS